LSKGKVEIKGRQRQSKKKESTSTERGTIVDNNGSATVTFTAKRLNRIWEELQKTEQGRQAGQIKFSASLWLCGSERVLVRSPNYFFEWGIGSHEVFGGSRAIANSCAKEGIRKEMPGKNRSYA